MIVHDRYPGYISWDVFLRVQTMLRDNYAEYDRNRTRGVAREGAALLQGIAYCGACGRKMVVQYKGGTRYLCNALRAQTRERVCQYLPADPVDAYVVDAFFEALAPAELDLYTKALEARHAREADVERAREREIERLRYEVHLARKQYDRVDPDNRLVASELERRWEVALRALHEAEANAAQKRRLADEGTTAAVSDELRAAFTSLGQSLPHLWQGNVLTRAQCKSLLRCLIDKVVVHRRQRDQIDLRVVWKGGAVTEAKVSIAVGSLRELTDFPTLEAKVLASESQGLSDEQIARQLTEEGFRSPQRPIVLPSTVKAIRLRHQRIHRFRGPRPRHVQGRLTLPQLARAIGVTPHWLYHQIRRGAIRATRDPVTKLYLFPDTPTTLERFRKLRERLGPPR